jgi:arsenate reductase
MRTNQESPMALTIYHNPRCSKSRKTLELIRDAGVEPEIVLYLEDTPTAEQIRIIAGKLGMNVADLLRRGESAFKEATNLPDLDDNVALATWVAANPIVLERPIVFDGDRAVVGRPPENVQALLS